MGLAVRVIPTLLVRGRTLVKGTQFDAWRSVGLAMQAVRIHQARGVDELVLLDIGATPEGRGPDLEMVRRLSECCFSPLAVGGGVRSVEDVRALLKAGADKVVIGAAAHDDGMIEQIAEAVGSQAIVVAIDVQDEAVLKGKSHTQWLPVPFAKRVAKAGAGEIIITDAGLEGTMTGYDLDLIRDVSCAVRIPVIAHGGAGAYQHMLEAVQAGASAVAAGALFQFTDATPQGAARYLQANGVEARVPT